MPPFRLFLLLGSMACFLVVTFADELDGDVNVNLVAEGEPCDLEERAQRQWSYGEQICYCRTAKGKKTWQCPDV